MDTQAMGTWLTTLGVGGVLAWGMFMFYRSDILKIHEREKDRSDNLLQVVKENTAAITLNTATINMLHKRIDGELTHFRQEERDHERHGV